MGSRGPFLSVVAAAKDQDVPYYDIRNYVFYHLKNSNSNEPFKNYNIIDQRIGRPVFLQAS